MQFDRKTHIFVTFSILTMEEGFSTVSFLHLATTDLNHKLCVKSMLKERIYLPSSFSLCDDDNLTLDSSKFFKNTHL